MKQFKWLLRINSTQRIRHLIEFGVISSDHALFTERTYTMAELPENYTILLQQDPPVQIGITSTELDTFEPLLFTITELKYQINNSCNIWNCFRDQSNQVVTFKQAIVRGALRNVFDNPQLLSTIDFKLQNYPTDSADPTAFVWDVYELTTQYPFIPRIQL